MPWQEFCLDTPAFGGDQSPTLAWMEDEAGSCDESTEGTREADLADKGKRKDHGCEEKRIEEGRGMDQERQTGWGGREGQVVRSKARSMEGRVLQRLGQWTMRSEGTSQ